MKTYIVGGWVRDLLRGVEPQDKDYVVVGSTQEELLSLGFEKVGASFPVFLHPVTKDEYALARKEKKSGVGYHGFAVDFSPTVTLEEDLSRRDLTINAIAYDPDKKEFVDPYEGRLDIQNKILKHVSDAFIEDPLRVFRLARFHALLPDFTIDQKTIDLVKEIIKSQEIKELARERIFQEIIKAHTRDHQPSLFWNFLIDYNALEFIVGEPINLLELKETFNQLKNSNIAPSHKILLSFLDKIRSYLLKFNIELEKKLPLTAVLIKELKTIKLARDLVQDKKNEAERILEILMYSRALHQLEKVIHLIDFLNIGLSEQELFNLVHLLKSFNFEEELVRIAPAQRTFFIKSKYLEAIKLFLSDLQKDKI